MAEGLKTLENRIEKLRNTIEHHVANVNMLLNIIKKLRRDIELATEIMSSEQQATFYEGVRLMDKAIADYEEE